ncbi:MAG: hypothetical protein AAGK47_04770 [Bacteroidota bacterium]
MSSRDFLKLQGLIAKLEMTTAQAAQQDGSFKKYHQSSVTLLKDLPHHFKNLEQGLRTAKFVD